MSVGAATLAAICPCPREISRPGTRTATDTVRRNILTCANMQERLHYDEDSTGSFEAEALPCRGRNDSTAASLQAPRRADTYDLPSPCCSARRTSSPSSGRTPPCSHTPPTLLCPDLRSGHRECL